MFIKPQMRIYFPVLTDYLMPQLLVLIHTPSRSDIENTSVVTTRLVDLVSRYLCKITSRQSQNVCGVAQLCVQYKVVSLTGKALQLK